MNCTVKVINYPTIWHVFSTCSAKRRHFALKRECVAVSSFQCCLATEGKCNSTIPPLKRQSGLSSTRATAMHRRGLHWRHGGSFPPASDKSILWWPRKCDCVFYGRIKKPAESADVEIVFQAAGSDFSGPLGASSGTARLQEGSPFYCATHFELHLASLISAIFSFFPIFFLSLRTVV